MFEQTKMNGFTLKDMCSGFRYARLYPEPFLLVAPVARVGNLISHSFQSTAGTTRLKLSIKGNHTNNSNKEL